MPIKLLIVDDDKLIRETYQSVLSATGYDVICLKICQRQN